MAERSGLTREKLLAAALDVYARGGSRAATTRRIAAQAGVNEVTLFRLFQSKDQLLEAALAPTASATGEFRLPSRPRSPRAELVSWSAVFLAHMRERAPVIRTCMAEAAERPEGIGQVTAIPRRALAELARYLGALRESGFVEDVKDSTALDAHAAGLIAALFTDGVTREILPEMFPPERQVPDRYVDSLLAALGVGRGAPPARVRAAPPPSLPDATGA